ncbi:MAG: hypothetical protein E7Z93_05465 [Cyanobacteria bacterium SIG32]|nr:hypothetical protein [Cyanobacteria bacterium SIG32]
MTVLTKEITSENEDKIKDIYESLSEMLSYCNVLYSALSNDREKPSMSDVANTIYLLIEHLEHVQNNTLNYIDFCEQSGLFGEMSSLNQ